MPRSDAPLTQHHMKLPDDEMERPAVIVSHLKLPEDSLS